MLISLDELYSAEQFPSDGIALNPDAEVSSAFSSCQIFGCEAERSTTAVIYLWGEKPNHRRESPYDLLRAFYHEIRRQLSLMRKLKVQCAHQASTAPRRATLPKITHLFSDTNEDDSLEPAVFPSVSIKLQRFKSQRYHQCLFSPIWNLRNGSNRSSRCCNSA